MTRDDFQARTGVSRETLDGFDRWRQILVETSAHTNLVARSSLDHFWERHALDSFQLMPLVSRETRLVADLGAGAGFPGIALALGFRDRGQAARVVMVDSVGKKVAFLHKVIEELGLDAEARPVRVEMLDPSEGFDLVTARAFAPLNKLLGYAEPLLKNGAEGLFFKGRQYRDELTEARKSWTVDPEVIPSQTSDGVILRIKEVERVR
ncbi:MAG: 16S rRNA (guanine(527)-N(7))-methyltransferase RsmG [Oceanicaulis sp.]|uniref:Ribosomal RNA small subunit methyltransferase G n=1 Tax=Maricaulis virginensis TaxID=144022 RepID=A0A9W6MP81_9PROT|nr:16S rRNA (guanine(527)-N(7))-methyltransferase RsmG [Maricaulis virginensis]MAC40025.1 16S rRNA (guanine(527)-N(7))-methyltransferase RsmG [Oceanicaulis sp.]MBI74853.1 16S rRNA (guanine(527)-N(7))-methyltransferase RsmG [Oceanicaulis sp.]GLK52872.1 ribosomal RNA small subunit methyltransferase G [Maricaulis virginensis]